MTKKIFFRNKHQKKKFDRKFDPVANWHIFKSGLSKKLSNISLKVTIEKKWRNQKFDLLSLKNSSPGQFLGDFQLTQMFLNSQSSCCNLQIRVLGAKLCVAFLLFQFWKKVLNSKNPCFLLNQNIDFNTNETESKTEIKIVN